MLRRTLVKRIAVGGAGVGMLLWGSERRDANRRRSEEQDEATLHLPQLPPIPERYGGSMDSGSRSEPPSGDHFVAPNGNDADSGTKEEPYETVRAAIRSATAGDVIYLRGGTYDRDRSITVDGPTGTARKPIVLAGYPGERPVFRFRGPTPGGWDHLGEGGLVFMGIRHWIVRNLSVTESPGEGIRLTDGSRDNAFENIAVANNNLSGFSIYDGSTRNEIRDLVSIDNYDRQNGGRDADGIVFSGVRNNTLRRAHLYNNSDDGVDLWKSRSIVVDRCLSWNNGRGENGNGNGFKLGGDEEGNSGGHTVSRCVAFNNRRSGFDHNGAAVEMDVYNNTAWNNPTNFLFDEAGHRLGNNISHEGSVELGESVVEAHNSWNLEITQPGFRSSFPKSSQFLHLVPTSPCVDAGIEIDGLRYKDEAPDLGAYEYDRSNEGS